MKKNKVYISIFLLIITICFLGTKVFASGDTFEDFIKKGDSFLNQAQNQTNSTTSSVINYSGLHNAFNVIYNLFFTAAIIIAVVYGFYIALRIIMGSIDEKADAKKMIIEYVKNVIWLALIPAVFGFILRLIP